MDSLTQFVLGAAISAVTLGPTIAPRRAAILGGLVATLPDLDVLLPAADPIQAFVGHRGFSHSVIVHTVITPMLGLLVERIDERLADRRWLTWTTIWLALVTHALLDCFTTYGTRILWPLSDVAVTWSSIFIIDPLYTVPLLVAVVMALADRPSARRAAGIALVLSSAYLGWTLVAERLAAAKVATALEAAGIRPERLMMLPMPFNSLLWRGLAIDGDRYVNVYRSLFDREAASPVFIHTRSAGVPIPPEAEAGVVAVATFTRGFHGFERVDGGLVLTDLRLGVPPNHVFSFRIARLEGDRAVAEAPVRLSRPYRSEALTWIWSRIFDEKAPRQE